MVRSRNAKTGVRIKNYRVKKRILIMGSSIGYVWSNFERTQIGYDVSQLKKEEMRLRETNRKLRLELAILKSPQNLETLAIEKLGLKQPSPEQIIVLP